MQSIHESRALERVGGLALALFEAAARSAREAARTGRRRWQAKRRRGCCLVPGTGTPLWNELLAAIRPHLRKRGRKAHLARLLGLPRQRLQDVFKAQTAMLDAERTLWVLCWIRAREQGHDLAT
jgi:hypothetical protein